MLKIHARRALKAARDSRRSALGHTMLHSIAQDIRFGLRTFRKRPGFTAVALVTLALGIGANAAIFSVVHAVLIRDLPYPAPDRLVRIYETFQGRRARGVANPFNYDVWERQTQSFERLAAMRSGMATLTGAGDPERVQVQWVMASFFDIMGLQPALGRLLTDADAAETRPLVLISHRLWNLRFGGHSNVLGRTLELEGERVSVVGVLPPAFGIPENCDIWRPYLLPAQIRAHMDSWYLGVVARLRPGVTIGQAQAEMDAISAQLSARFPAQRRNRGVWVIGLQQDLASRVEEALGILQGVVGFVLLVACANVANLLMASASGRSRELSIRASLGAGRARLIRQLVTESVLLAVAGGLVGVTLAAWGVRILVAMAPEFTLPASATIGVDWAVLAFTIGLSVVTGLVASVAPALLFARSDAADTLKDTSQGSAGTGRSGQRLRSSLVALEVALALVLVTGSTLLIRSFVQLARQDPGFSAERLLTADISLPARTYPTPVVQQQFWRSLFERLQSMPGTIGVGASTALPFSTWEWQTWFEIRGREDVKNTGSSIRTVTPGYVATLALPVLSGRALSESDTSGSEPVVMVNEAFVRQHLSGLNPIGQQLHTERPGKAGRTTTLIGVGSEPPASAPWLTVVGVVGNTRHTALDADARPEIYRPLAQSPTSILVIAIRTAGDPESLAAALRQEVHALDPNLPTDKVRTMTTLIGRTVARRRFEMWLFSLFGALGAVLAAIGIYGVMAYVVGLRQREIGIRLALGARAGQVRTLVTRQGLRPVVIGLLLGLGAVWFLGGLLESRLFGVTPHDPATVLATSVGFLIVALLACWMPARRAGKADPVMVLRNE